MLGKISEPTLDSVYIVVRERFGFSYKQRRSAEDISNLTTISIYRRKQDRREKVGNKLRNNEGYKKLLEWMFNIQKYFNWNDEEFAKQLGYSNRRMIQCFKRFEGSLPSRKVLLRLFELDKMMRIRIKEGE